MIKVRNRPTICGMSDYTARELGDVVRLFFLLLPLCRSENLGNSCRASIRENRVSWTGSMDKLSHFGRMNIIGKLKYIWIDSGIIIGFQSLLTGRGLQEWTQVDGQGRPRRELKFYFNWLGVYNGPKNRNGETIVGQLNRSTEWTALWFGAPGNWPLYRLHDESSL